MVISPFMTRASHIIGGDMYYEYLGGSTYKVYISAYRDCLSSGADFDSPLILGVFRKNSNVMVGVYRVPYFGKVRVPVQFNNPCVVPPSNICVENSVYSITVELPPLPGGYVLSYTRCCRGPQINNLSNPDDQGLTLTVNIPGIEDNNYQNSSPRFSGYPPLLLCNNDDLVFNHSATDPDGDQLVYSLATPYQGGTSFDPAPNPPPAPPYRQVQWAGAYSPTIPLGPGSSLTIDPNTGVLTAAPNLAGRYVVGIRVSEYRNGVLISSMIRDFIFQVFNCNITMRAILPSQDQMVNFNGFCTGDYTVNFQNNSFGGTNYKWNFNDPNSGANNTSSLFAPSHTYSDTGHYRAQLIVNPGWPCTDTATVDIYIYNSLTLNHNTPAAQCLTNNSFQFNANSSGPATTIYQWNLGNTATTPLANGNNVTTSFNTPGIKNISIKAKHSVCEIVKNFTIEVLPSPTTQFTVPQDYRCEGLEVQFNNTSTNSQGNLWTFGDGTSSTDLNPSHQYTNPGTYTVKLVTTNGGLCKDSLQTTLVLNEKIILGLPPQPDKCILDNSYDFVGTGTGPIGTDYFLTITDGQATRITGKQLLNYSFQNVGDHQVTLSGEFEGCRKDTTIDIKIIRVPFIDFKLNDGLACVPFAASFLNQSIGDTELFYEWDFGNGDTSTEIHPSTIYTAEGVYTIKLRLWAHEGCVDTLTVKKTDYVWVYPKPEAAFSTDKTVLDPCNSGVQFKNLTAGDLYIQYDFDDSGARSNDTDPFYIFNNEEYHYVRQYVETAHGCRDTAEIVIYVNPFTVFIPNSFTPNGDEFNQTLKTALYYDPVDWELIIFNRWGEKVFESHDPKIEWDGTYNGKKAPDGIYNYKLSYRPCHLVKEDRKIVSGTVTILR